MHQLLEDVSTSHPSRSKRNCNLCKGLSKTSLVRLDLRCHGQSVQNMQNVLPVYEHLFPTDIGRLAIVLTVLVKKS